MQDPAAGTDETAGVVAQPPPPEPAPAVARSAQEAERVEAMRRKVEEMLTQFLGIVQVDRSGTFTFPHESTRVFVNVRPFRGESTLVNVFAYTNIAVPATPDLFRYVATHADDYIFGHLGARQEEDATVTIIFRHTLLGEHLDPEELRAAVGAVAITADELDDEIRSRFGGRVFQEPAQSGDGKGGGDAAADTRGAPGYL